ncbi:MAG: selenide, water dikinase SelD [Oligoflexales bacterium]|nr:selenide, water dikinase SelD [Oligoflexales bacterium]
MLRQASIFIIGGGVAGIEIALSLRARFSKSAPGLKLNIHIAHSGKQILPELTNSARKRMEKLLAEADISVIYNAELQNLTRDSISIKGFDKLDCHFCIVCSGAKAPSWPSESGIQVDKRGFILVNEYLQSLSHPKIFAAGDVAQISRHPLPRAGVYAVRQAEPLAYNLKQLALGQKLIKYKPQKNFLKLIGTGGGKALAIKSNVHFHGKTPWKLKQLIDKKFMDQLSPKTSWLQSMQESKPTEVGQLTQQHAQTIALANMRCGGCAAKWDEGVLSEILEDIRKHPRLNACLTSSKQAGGLQTPDDAAVFTPKPGFDLLQSIDFMPCITSDPYLFGRILVNHSFNDIYAMGGLPHSAQALLMLPYVEDKIAASDGRLLMRGIAEQIVAEGCNVKLIGGHTCEGSPLSAGIVCNGIVRSHDLLRKEGIKPGDQLIISKPLGTGVIFAAAMRLATQPQWIEAATSSMLQSHCSLQKIFTYFPGEAATDISGFGLMGHLLEMVFPAKKDVRLFLDQIPTLPGALECLDMGIRSTIHAKNSKKAQFLQTQPQLKQERYDILFDPQTSGPLLFSVPKESAHAFVSKMRIQGFSRASVIGEVCSSWTPRTPVSLS